MRRTTRSAGLLALTASTFLAVSTGIPGASAAPRASDLDALGTSQGNATESSGLIAEVNQVETNESGNILSVTWSIENQASERVVLTWLYGRTYTYSGANFSGVTVASNEGASRHHPVMDGMGECLCSGNNSSSFKERLEVGDKVSYWSMFSVPGDVDAVTIEIPGFEPIEDVPIS
ncbi:hypothetical protein ACIRPH_04965 [Nocardiopsis sp. NPDC101807]|uniref:hypothetical protein n=1 Tax=Nocardiopsis sp. NPDC101807 TaxID=3364339 RepID=UPI003822D26B